MDIDCIGLYHGLVSRFTADNMKALIDLCDEDACTVRLGQETIYVAMGDMRHGWHLATPITSLFKVRNKTCGYSFSYLEQGKHFETKLEQI